MKFLDFLEELIIRLVSPTPKFQKIIRNTSMSITALATFIIALQAQGVVMPEWLHSMFSWNALFGGAFGAFIAQLSVIWYDEEGGEINNRIGGGIVKNPK